MSGESTLPWRVAIVGGGISGLAAAARLGELAREAGRSLQLTLLEEQGRLGGSLGTVAEDDMLLDTGPDQFVTHKAAGVDLCQRLGLGSELIELGGERFAPHLLHEGRPLPLPAGFAIMAPTRLAPLLSSRLFSSRGKARIALERFVPPRRDRGDESLRSFVVRRFGRELFERVAEPILAGIFTSDADRMSMAMTLPRYVALERQFRSVTRGLSAARHAAASTGARQRASLIALRSGFGTLVDRLAARLGDRTLRLRARVERIVRDEGRASWTVAVAGGSAVEADRVVLACPTFVAARLLSWDQALGRELDRLDYAGCATVYLLYPQGALTRPLGGSGFFVPRTAREPVLACSYVTNKFPDRAPRGSVLLRVFLGGARHPEALDLDDDALSDLAARHVERVLGPAGPPRARRCFRHPRSMPQFVVGDRERFDAMARRLAGHPGLVACGAAVGATGVADCIASGENAAELALAPEQDSRAADRTRREGSCQDLPRQTGTGS